MSIGSVITVAGKLLALVPGAVDAGKAIASLFGRKAKPDPAVAEANRHATQSGAARNASGAATGKMMQGKRK